MAQFDRDARAQLVRDLAVEAERLGRALSQLGEVYDHLDETSAQELEGRLFRPLQKAYAVAVRAVRRYAEGHGLEVPDLTSPPPPLPASGVRELIERALEEVEAADAGIAAVQDGELFPEISDPQLRAGLGEVRTALAGCAEAGRALSRGFGR